MTTAEVLDFNPVNNTETTKAKPSSVEKINSLPEDRLVVIDFSPIAHTEQDERYIADHFGVNANEDELPFIDSGSINVVKADETGVIIEFSHGSHSRKSADNPSFTHRSQPHFRYVLFTRHNEGRTVFTCSLEEFNRCGIAVLIKPS